MRFIIKPPIFQETPQVASRQGGLARGLFYGIDGMINSMIKTAQIEVGAR
jgi:hypothetical protein